MEPSIQYAQTKDGVSIAFSTVGRGAPLVHMPWMPFGHLQLDWQIHELRSLCERLSRNRMLVRYDGRGSGVSDRDVTDYSLDAHLSDLEAVVNRLGLRRFALLGFMTTGPVAIAYATRHPERVSHLILWCTWARSADAFGSTQAQGMLGLVDKDWELFTETMSHAGMGWSEGAPAHRWAAVARESVTQEAAKEAIRSIRDVDVTNLLSQVKTPTLVLHRREAPVPNVKAARGLASRIPDARLVLLEGSSWAMYLGDTEAVASAIDEFLGEGEDATAEPEPAEPCAFRTVLFTDVEGSTALTQRLGDTKARELLREHERMVREALKSHGGSEVKTMGDGFMASFSSATKALECAIAMQRAFAEHNEGAEEPIKVRIGLNAGEPIAEDEDLFGTAVNLAARICGHADPGQILAPIVVRELAAGKQFMLADLGETELRGFEDPVRLYELRWREAG
jgi:class 3 adenylate cyclase